MIENELFELCKEVYNNKNWGVDFDTVYRSFEPETYEISEGWLTGNIPLYTTDYLLEKLPKYTQITKTAYRASVEDDQFRLGYRATSDDIFNESFYADTPLKSLLKLVIALDDAGVKL